MKHENEQAKQTQIVKPKRQSYYKPLVVPKVQSVKSLSAIAKERAEAASAAREPNGKTEPVRVVVTKAEPPKPETVVPAHEEQPEQKVVAAKQTEPPKQAAESAIPAENLSQVEPAAQRKEKKKNGAKEGGKCGAAQKVLAPVSSTLNGIASDYSDRSAVRQTFIAMFKLKVPICILLAVIIALSAVFLALQSSNTASTEMSLNYEESAYGLNPNSTRYNVYNIASAEVVGNMLTYCGADPEAYDLTAISDCISVNPTNKKAFNEETLFITTTYKITLSNPPRIPGVSTKQMLTFLCKAYKDFLYSNYTENRAILSFSIDRFHDEEYLEIADLLDLKAQQLEKYLNMRVKQAKAFTEKESNETFKSLSQKIEDLRNYDIAKYRAFVIEAGCSHDKARFLRSLSYINRMKQIDYDKDISAYNVYNAGIKIYDESMISNVLIPSKDQNKKTYYMSKTKTGMDYMAQQADDYLSTAQETAKEIKINSEIMNKMQAGSNAPASIQKATAMIENIRTKFDELSSQIETVDKAYIKYKTKDYLTFKSTNRSLMQTLQVSKLALIAFVMIVLIYAVIWLRFKNVSGGRQK